MTIHETFFVFLHMPHKMCFPQKHCVQTYNVRMYIQIYVPNLFNIKKIIYAFL
jgi:hypothetical protein